MRSNSPKGLTPRSFWILPGRAPGDDATATARGLEFGQAEFDEIDAYCRTVGIDWFASAWDVPSQLFLRQYKLKYNKIASPMLTMWTS